MKGIEKTAGVCGGAACIEGTRIAVWIIASYIRQSPDSSAEEQMATLLEAFPSLTASNIIEAVIYAVANHDEIDLDVAENEEGA